MYFNAIPFEVAAVPQSGAVNGPLDSFPKDSLSVPGVSPTPCFLSGADSLRCPSGASVSHSRAVQCYIINSAGVFNNNPSRKLFMV